MRAQEKESDLITLRKELEDVKDKLRRAQRDRDVYANKIAQMAVAVGNTGSQTGGDGYTPVAHKSAKIPDPPMLTDGKEPQFEDWLLLMRQKLATNHDHFDAPELCMAYVASCCDGKAQRHIIPHLCEDAHLF